MSGVATSHWIIRYGSTISRHRRAFSATTISTLVAQVRATDVMNTSMMHARLLKTPYVHMLPVANSLLASYDPTSAAKLFDQMPLRDHVSWTSIIGASLPAEAVALFRRMLRAAVRVDGVVLVVLLRASAALRDAHLGSSLHALATRRGLLTDVFVANSLVHVYSECLRLRSAREVFDSIPDKNAVSWNTMLSGLLHADRCSEALHLSTGQGQQLQLHADATTLAVLLQLCKKLATPSCCRAVHAMALRKLLLMASTPLLDALLDAYAKCGLVTHSLRLFQRMPLSDRSVVTWSTVIAACAGSGRPHKAMAYFVAMRQAGQQWPNSITMLSLLEACASRAEIGASRCAHGVALRCGLASELAVGNAIVDMYGKCGDLPASRRVFGTMTVKDVLSWNSMIGVLGMNGCALDALALVGEMERCQDVTPNGVTLLAVLSACAHGGLVQQGVALLERLPREHFMSAHLTSIADMLARAGDLDGAAQIAGAGDSAAWSAVLSGCRTRNHYLEVSQEAARRVVELEPDNSAGYLMAAMGAVNNGGMRRAMRERGVKVSGGYSMVHVAQQEHRFASWDGRHPQRLQVYAMLHLLHCHMMHKPATQHHLYNN
jgi:pentatricopeptide repeat protein